MKSTTKKIFVLILFGMGFMCLPNLKLNFSFGQKSNVKIPKQSVGYTKSFIHVDGNWTETADDNLWCYGLGTWQEPYVIENVTVDCGGTGSGILIENSDTEYFIIRNCTVYNAGSGGYDAGIKLENTNNGTLTNNNCSNNPQHGILLFNYCENNTISENTANYNTNFGITLKDKCNSNTITGNSIHYSGYYGIYLKDDCHQNKIINNTANSNREGIKLDWGGPSCTYNSIINNTANYNSEVGIHSHVCTNNNFTGNTVNDNGGRGIYIEFSNLNNIINNTANRNGIVGISIYNAADDNTLTNNIATENTKYGIELYHSEKNKILNNTVNRNGHTGIYLNYPNADYNNITGNTVNDNVKIGIFVYWGCDSNNVKNNTIKRNNLGIGLKRDSNNNNVSENILIDNGICIFELGCTGNIIEDNTCSGSFKELPIFINGTATGVGAHNWTWVEQQSWFGGGSGTKDIPYIIENLNRDGLAMTNCIEIINSNVYFIVRNSTFYNSGLDSVGIKLNNVSNGTLTQNNCSFNTRGISLGSDCDFNNITGNIANNNDGIGIFLGDYCDFNNITGNKANNNDGTGIYLGRLGGDCDFNNIIGNNANNNTDNGIYLNDKCDNNTISQNTASHNGDTGIFLSGGGVFSSYNDTFSENTAENNDYGIQLEDDCHFNVISGNIIKSNNFGINFDSKCSNNSVHRNIFLNNGKHAIDDGTDNKWNSSTIGNYWDNWTSPDTTPLDGIVDDPYTYIAGFTGSIDYLPIAEDGAPSITINSPDPGDVFAVSSPSFNVRITDDYLDVMWYTLDGGLHNYTFTDNGTIDPTAWGMISEGNVTLTFYASDIPGNIGSADVIIVKDFEAPVININSPTPDEYFGSTTPSFNARITDDYLDVMWYTLDGGLHNYTFTANSTIDQPAWNAMADGAVILKFYANDTFSHIGSAEVSIIKDTTAPVIIINSPAEGDSFGSSAPLFNITITEDNLEAIWYSFDGGVTTYTVTDNTIFDQTAWAALAQGDVTITFYARDLAGNEASESVTVIKSVPSGLDPGVIITIVVISIVGGVALVVVVYIFIKKRATPA